MTFTALRAALADVVAIPVTPYRDGAPDVPTFKTLLRRLITSGVTTITPNGNTSEFYALTTEERHVLIEASAEAAGDDAFLLLGIGHDIQTAITDARLGRGVGIPMAMIHQPTHPHISAPGWVEYHAQIASAVPEMGFVLYIRNEWVTAAMLVELSDRCPNVIGIKYALPDPTQFARIRDLAGADRFVWVAGLAEPYALSYAAHGAAGFTSGLVNVNPELSLALRDALRDGNYPLAGALLARISRFEEMRAEHRSANNVSVVKEALAQLGLCDRAIRPPSREVNDSDRTEIADILADWATTHNLLPTQRRPSKAAVVV
ncbi:dihydrodipicolinate synthetase family protein [Pseudarthrobacter siccitolerans]|uniref:Dihydrodipicolinate synthetase family protein n=1 Tax=Pseudarthrobacter siccitolerans TaxID=861266 RepID=A0A024GX43_9MICC|nr:dihydrodipicolinate synthase family protein [Pseudarthrobacter siccitolerans]CCQ44202.1 dihydrodipicolinate synthetase family protein [Pseudarthrobacter siccitolerans]